jgi:hypothetical protein
MRRIVARLAALTLLLPLFTAPTAVSAGEHTFDDDDGRVHEPAIEALADEGVVDGCDEDRFCPDDPVRRDQMATFIMAAASVPASGDDAFTDDGGSVHHDSINAIAAAGIVAGCGDDRFCPGDPITRAQMATFLVAAFDLPTAELDWFTDENGNLHENNIDAVADAGLAAGCDDVSSRFCPHLEVTRAQMATFIARGMELVPRVQLLLERGDERVEVETIQAALHQRRYWVGPRDGIYGQLTEQAVYALQKQRGLLVDGIVGPEVRAALGNPDRAVARSSNGRVFEVDKTRQLLHMVRNGTVVWTWNTSTGTEDYYTYDGRRYKADTPNGRWDVYREIDGWRESHLGELYRPKYFHTDGIAIHGYDHVPPRPASHGCVRVTIEAMDWMWANDVIPIHTPVWVYGQTPST